MSECSRCGKEDRYANHHIHAVGYHRSADANAGDPMTTCAFLCEDCIKDVFGEYTDWHNDTLIPQPE